MKNMSKIGLRGEREMKDIFISHASEDNEDLVRPLVKELERYGVDI